MPATRMIEAIIAGSEKLEQDNRFEVPVRRNFTQFLLIQNTFISRSMMLQKNWLNDAPRTSCFFEPHVQHLRMSSVWEVFWQSLCVLQKQRVAEKAN